MHRWPLIKAGSAFNVVFRVSGLGPRTRLTPLTFTWTKNRHLAGGAYLRQSSAPVVATPSSKDETPEPFRRHAAPERWLCRGGASRRSPRPDSAPRGNAEDAPRRTAGTRREASR